MSVTREVREEMITSIAACIRTEGTTPLGHFKRLVALRVVANLTAGTAEENEQLRQMILTIPGLMRPMLAEALDWAERQVAEALSLIGLRDATTTLADVEDAARLACAALELGEHDDR